LERQLERLEKNITNQTKTDVSKSVGVIRMGGIGDLVLLSASLLAFKEKYPLHHLVLVTKAEHMDLLKGAEYIDEILPLVPWADAKFLKKYDLRWAVEDKLTHNLGKLSEHDFTTKDRSDIFDKLMGVESEKKFVLPIQQDILASCMDKLKAATHPIIAIGATCTQVLREIPLKYIEPLIEELQSATGGTIVLLGKTKPRNEQLAKIEGQRILNFVDKTTIPELVAICSLMDLVITPDTGLMHIAGALQKNTLALMGCIPPQCRVTYYPTVTALYPEGELPCIPCYGLSTIPGHGSLACKQPGKILGECMQLLTPERIVKEVRNLLAIPEPVKVAFIHDVSLDYPGGAEISSKRVVDVGREMGYDIQVFSMENNKNEFYNLAKFDLIILSNIWGFDFERMDGILDSIKKVPYVKYEHDHRSLDKLAEGKYPIDDVAKPIFQNSILNVYVSPQHKKDHEETFGPGGYLFLAPVDVDKYRPVPGIERKLNTALVGVPRKHFNVVGYRPTNDAGLELRTFMEEHPHITVDFLYQGVPADSMPELYSRYEYFIHLPQGGWACDRMPLEAALCGCKVITNEKSGVLSWGKDLSDVESLRDWLSNSPGPLWEEIGKLLNRGEA